MDVFGYQKEFPLRSSVESIEREISCLELNEKPEYMSVPKEERDIRKKWSEHVAMIESRLIRGVTDA